MIDFRYHIVSLTAVFLALAVGVVLGSGPLRTALVEELTNETDLLRQQLSEAEREIEAERLTGVIGEEFVEDASATLIGGVLDGLNVALIHVHDPSTTDVNAIRERLVQAGANVTTNVTIEDEWTSGEQAAFRSSFASQVADNVIGVDATVAPQRMLAHTLAQALRPDIVPEGADGEGTDLAVDFPDASSASDRAAVLVDLLKGGDFISGTITGDVNAVVVIAGPGPPDEDVRATESETFAQLAGVLDEYLESTVIASGDAVLGDLPTAVQSSALLNGRVSTVAHGLNFYGNFTVVLALAQEVTGETDHFGLGEELTLFPGS